MTLADRIGVLNRGKLQQFGPPLEIYRRPANRFVAGFFGSPSMNILMGEIRVENGQSVFVSGAIRLAGLGSHEWLQNLPSKEVLLGIRPHEVELGRADISTPISATHWHRGIVRSLEPLGDAAVVRIALESKCEVVAKVAANNSHAIGNAIRVTFPPEKLHFFAADESGRRLN